MKQKRISALTASVLCLCGVNVSLGVAVSMGQEHRPDAVVTSEAEQRPGMVIYQGFCPDCANSPIREQITLDSDKAQYACCDRLGFCDVCTACNRDWYRWLGWC